MLIDGSQIVFRVAAMSRIHFDWQLDFGISTWTAVLHRDPCSYCGCCPAGTVDHITPRSQGGGTRHRPMNSAAACASCNVSRGAMPLLQFLIVRKDGPERWEQRQEQQQEQRRAKRASKMDRRWWTPPTWLWKG